MPQWNSEASGRARLDPLTHIGLVLDGINCLLQRKQHYNSNRWRISVRATSKHSLQWRWPKKMLERRIIQRVELSCDRIWLTHQGSQWRTSHRLKRKFLSKTKSNSVTKEKLVCVVYIFLSGWKFLTKKCASSSLDVKKWGVNRQIWGLVPEIRHFNSPWWSPRQVGLMCWRKNWNDYFE